MAVVAVAAITACCGSAAVAACCGSAAIAACCVSAAITARSDFVAATADCGSETSAVPREPSLAAVAAFLASRDALDERRLVGTAPSDLSTLAGARGGTVGTTLRT
jgi:hypothetical protein